MLRVAGATGPLHAWATRGRDGTLRIVMINDDPHTARELNVRLPVAHGTASLERLEAPALDSTSGVTLGGQGFGQRTTTGRLAGTPRLDTVKPSGRSYLIKVPAGSAALLTVSAG
jgi:hypothetical protein